MLQFISIPMVIAFSGGVGALFGVQGARPFWHVGMYPIAFLVTALTTGAGLMTFLAAFFVPNHSKEHDLLVRALARLLAIFLVVETLFVFADYSMSLYGGLPMNVAAVMQVLNGPYWWGFWILQMLIGTLVPFIILIMPGLRRSNGILGLAGASVLVGFTAVRINAVLPGLTIPEMEGLRSAFSDPRLGFEYFPSLTEWAITVGVTGFAALIFLVAHSRLNLVKGEA